MPPIIKGSSAVYAGQRRRFVPGQGWTLIDIWRFPNSADAIAFADSEAADGTKVVDFDNRAPDYQVEISTPDSGGDPEEDVFDVFELPPLDETSDVTDSPAFRALTSAEQDAIKRYMDGDLTFDQALDLLDTTPSAPDVLLLIHRGTRQYVKPTTEFRWTRTLTDSGLAASLSGAFGNVGRIFTTSTLVGSVSPPAAWASAINAADDSIPAPLAGYATGWLKMQPAITRRGINRNDIAMRWVLENWSTLLYGAAI